MLASVYSLKGLLISAKAKTRELVHKFIILKKDFCCSGPHSDAAALWRAPFLEFWIPVLNRASCKGLATLANCGINGR